MEYLELVGGRSALHAAGLCHSEPRQPRHSSGCPRSWAHHSMNLWQPDVPSFTHPLTTLASRTAVGHRSMIYRSLHGHPVCFDPSNKGFTLTMGVQYIQWDEGCKHRTPGPVALLAWHCMRGSVLDR
jgi:hypothetical protein